MNFLLANQVAGEDLAPADERMKLTFIDLPDSVVPPVPATPMPGRSRGNSTRTQPVAPVAFPGVTESTALTPGVDWYGDASQAASREATRTDVRNFGFPKREPKPREKKEFGWDKTHTERVSAMPGGGMLIRLNDNCAITLSPLPIGGCALGKRKARGDLFDEMKAPVEAGDWK